MTPTEMEAVSEVNETSVPVEQLQGSLRRYCFSLTGSRWDGEDLAQDSWLKALPVLQREDHANPQALLFRIARNSWIDRQRRRLRLTDIEQRELRTLARFSAGSQEHSMLEIEAAFRSMLKHLTPLQRTIFLLRDVWAYSAEETAELLHTTSGAVKAALHRARLLLGAVREELLQGGPVEQAENESTAMLVRALAEAYQLADIDRLVLLAGSGSLEPAGAVALAGTRLLQQTVRRTRTESRPVLATRQATIYLAAA